MPEHNTSPPPGQPLQASAQQSPGVEDPDATASAITDEQPPSKKQRQDDATIVQRATNTVTEAAQQATQQAAQRTEQVKQAVLDKTREAVLWAESDGTDRAKQTAAAVQDKAAATHDAVTKHAAGVQAKAGAAVAAVVDRGKSLVGQVESTVVQGLRGTVTGAGRLLQGAGGGLEKLVAEPTELETQAGACCCTALLRR